MSDSMDSIQSAVKELEELRESRLVVYFLGDRNPFVSQISDDAVPPLCEQLAALAFENRRKVLDLFVYARGGSISAAVRIVSLIREFSDEFNIFIPYKCHHAGTLMALGADRIFMGPMGELTPIDQAVSDTSESTGNLKGDPGWLASDMRALLTFLKKTAKIKDSSAISAALTSNRSGMIDLSLAQRIGSYIPSAARSLLASRREKLSEQEILHIIDTLTEKMDSRLHRVTREEAKEIGLKVSPIKPEWEEPLDKLYRAYEHFLRLNDPISPEEEMEAIIDVKNTENIPLAVIESTEKRYIYRGNLSLRKRRRIPDDPDINVNLALKLSPEEDSRRLSQEMQTLLENLKKQATRNIQTLVQRELQRQSPVTDVEMKLYGGKWILED